MTLNKHMDEIYTYILFSPNNVKHCGRVKRT